MAGSAVTPQEIRRLSPDALDSLFASRQAVEFPLGTFRGEAWSDDFSFVAAFGNMWQGKVFYKPWLYKVLDRVWPKNVSHVAVRNTIRGKRLIPGVVTLVDGSVYIDYPQLGLRDELKPIQAGLWLGRMQLGPSVIWFTLEQS